MLVIYPYGVTNSVLVISMNDSDMSAQERNLKCEENVYQDTCHIQCAVKSVKYLYVYQVSQMLKKVT